ncbi:MAG: hypothetical protein IH588_14985 [Anaerolineales bacterium]|nr:hypothetical protein [Anaerolineales bacterium]
MPTCTPPTNDPNPYRTPDTDIRQLTQQLTPEGLGNQYLEQDAFNLLKKEVKNWSAHEDVFVKENLIVRITITYISPELVDALILNQVAYVAMKNFGGSLPLPTLFTEELKSVKRWLAKREEHLFLMTLTASEYWSKIAPEHDLIIDIPIKNLALTNSSEIPIIPSHADMILENQINLQSNPEYGYLGYPLAVMNGVDCILSLDQQWDTSMTFSIPDIKVNYSSKGSITWAIGMQPFLPVNDFAKNLGGATAPFIPLTGGSSDLILQEDPPPAVNGIGKEVENAQYWDTYWSGMSRYIWYTLTTRAHH